MKSTPFTQIHKGLNAKMAEFAGYNMPISYSGINDEHFAVRNKVGVFDVSHMGEFILKGADALDLIQRTTSNDASKLETGQAQYSCFPNNENGIIDDLIIYCLEPQNTYMLVVNAGNIAKDWAWLQKHNSKNVEMHNISDKTALLAIQGPEACKILQALTPVDLQSLRYYTFEKNTFAGVDNVLISATGYTGAGGIEIYFEDKNDDAKKIWDAIFASDTAVKPCGLGARDTLRMEMGYCLYGNDIDDTTSTLEAGLGWITKLRKTTPFVQQEKLMAQKEAGLQRKLVCFEMVDRGIPRHGYLLKNADGNEIGKVTSGTQSPTLGKAIGLGYVAIGHANLDAEIFVEIRSKLVKAQIVKAPFI